MMDETIQSFATYIHTYNRELLRSQKKNYRAILSYIMYCMYRSLVIL
jgi:hypothetical protein